MNSVVVSLWIGLSVLAQIDACLRHHGAGTSHCGVGRPGDDSHSLMCEAVSNWRAFRKRLSRSLPAGSVRAFCLSRSASRARRSRNVIVCVKRFLCMALLPILWGGSAISVLITDDATGQSGDEDGVGP